MINTQIDTSVDIPTRHTCVHTPCCPTADDVDRDAAHVVSARPEQGWSLLCNGVVVFEDFGELLPERAVHRLAPRGPARGVPAPPRQLTTPRIRAAARRPRQPSGRHLLTRSAIQGRRGPGP